MLELNIITKNGILVFSHSFFGDRKQAKDKDMEAGLLTAVLNVLRETQGEAVSSIRQKDYHLVLYEGVLTYGILTTHEDDPGLHVFIRKLVLKFELMYTYELHRGTVFNRREFEPFREIVKREYAALLNIDVSRLGKILEVMQRSSFTNYIIYEDKFFNPVFTNIVDPNISTVSNRITQIFRGIVDFGININQDHLTSDITFDTVHLHAIMVISHSIVVISDKRFDCNKTKKELQNIRAKLIEISQIKK